MSEFITAINTALGTFLTDVAPIVTSAVAIGLAMFGVRYAWRLLKGLSR